jgi:hypothetical protein
MDQGEDAEAADEPAAPKKGANLLKLPNPNKLPAPTSAPAT